MTATTPRGSPLEKEPPPAVKVYGPMLLSVTAIAISLVTMGTQQGALREQREQLETQREQLETQRHAVEAQEQALEDAEDRWKRDGTQLGMEVLTQGEGDEGMAHSGIAFPDDERDSVYFDHEDYERFDRFYVTMAVTNYGRGVVLVADVSGELAHDDLNPHALIAMTF